MKFSRFLICALAMAVLCLGGKARAAEEPAAISFGIISTESSITLKQLWEPFIEAMSKRTGVPVKAYFASDYAGIIEAMRFGKVDVAWTGNKGAMGMVDRSGGEIFAQAISAGGESGYYSLLIVNKDSSLKTLDAAELYVLHIDDQPAAFMIVYRHRNHLLMPKLAIDTSFSRYSPGILLILEASKRWIDEGVADFDMCRGDERYKKEMGGQNEPLCRIDKRL